MSPSQAPSSSTCCATLHVRKGDVTILFERSTSEHIVRIFSSSHSSAMLQVSRLTCCPLSVMYLRVFQRGWFLISAHLLPSFTPFYFSRTRLRLDLMAEDEDEDEDVDVDVDDNDNDNDDDDDEEEEQGRRKRGIDTF
jgi:hypothetical protein